MNNITLNLSKDDLDVLVTALDIYSQNNQMDIDGVNPDTEPGFYAFALKRRKQIKKMQALIAKQTKEEIVYKG